METKLNDHQEITHSMVLKPHKAHRLHYFETHSLYPGSFRKFLNNLTFIKFVRFSTSFLSRDFLSISHVTRCCRKICDYNNTLKKINDIVKEAEV